LAKRDLKLSRVVKRLDGFEVVLIDDLGYVQQSREEMEVLFTLLAERYERGSVWLTSNLPFFEVGEHLQRPNDDGGGDRPLGASQRDPGVEPAELPARAGEEDDGDRRLRLTLGARPGGRRGQRGCDLTPLRSARPHPRCLGFEWLLRAFKPAGNLNVAEGERQLSPIRKGVC